MDFKNMSPAQKRLITAMMIGDIFSKDLGVLITKDTKIMVKGVDDREFHYEGPEIRATEGSIFMFGLTEEDKAPYEIITAENNTVVLKKVVFFKAKIVTSYQSTEQLCVAGADRDEAMKVLKDYMKNGDYIRILSFNPSDFFEPLIK